MYTYPSSSARLSLFIRAPPSKTHRSQSLYYTKKKKKKSAHFSAPHVRPGAVAVKPSKRTHFSLVWYSSAYIHRTLHPSHPSRYPKIATTDLSISSQPTKPKTPPFSSLFSPISESQCPTRTRYLIWLLLTVRWH
jgi:hypothetical protein